MRPDMEMMLSMPACIEASSVTSKARTLIPAFARSRIRSTRRAAAYTV